MSTTEKVAVSLPKGIAQRARRAVRQGRAPSMSAYVAAALDEKSKFDDLAALLDEMLADSGGPLSAAERRDADRLLGLVSKKSQTAEGRQLSAVKTTTYTGCWAADGGAGVATIDGVVGSVVEAIALTAGQREGQQRHAGKRH